MDVLVYEIPDLVKRLVISTRGNIGKLQGEYFGRFGDNMKVDYRVSEPGRLSIGGEDYWITDQPRSDKPVIFETPYYFVEVEFDENADVKPDSMFVRHRLEEVAGRFIARGRVLSGQLSFVNEPGKFRLEIVFKTSTAERSFWIEFMVASTKMNVYDDYRKILEAVENEDRNLVFSAYSKTIGEASVRNKAQQAGDWRWGVYFESAVREFETALKRILHEPHKRIVAREDYHRANRVRHWTPSMAREWSRFEHDSVRLQVHRFRTETSDNTFDTYENRFLKFVLREMGTWLTDASKLLGEDSRLSQDFREGLRAQATRFAQYSRAPLWRSVGRFVASPNGSLVLQMRPGYAQIRVIWDLLHSLFTSTDLGSRKFSVGFNSLAALYEFWCFLQMRELLDNMLGGEESGTFGRFRREDASASSLSVSRVLENALSKEDDPDVESIGYKYTDGRDTIAELFFQQSYGPNSDTADSMGYARPFCQRPDIVLRLFQGDKSYTYLFDAKYQLEAGVDNLDAAPRAALDQMHRYRDAILYRQGRPTRDVVGAYIVYPGDEERDLFPYANILEEQNIGAFPLLPNKHETLRKFLLSLFARAFSPDRDYTEWLVDNAIPQRHLAHIPVEQKNASDPIILIHRTKNL